MDKYFIELFSTPVFGLGVSHSTGGRRPSPDPLPPWAPNSPSTWGELAVHSSSFFRDSVQAVRSLGTADPTERSMEIDLSVQTPCTKILGNKYPEEGIPCLLSESFLVFSPFLLTSCHIHTLPSKCWKGALFQRRGPDGGSHLVASPLLSSGESGPTCMLGAHQKDLPSSVCQPPATRRGDRGRAMTCPKFPFLGFLIPQDFHLPHGCGL